MRILTTCLIFTLSFTGIYVTNIANINISIFLLTFVATIPLVFARLLLSGVRIRQYQIYFIVIYILLNSLYYLGSAKLTSVAYSIIFIVAFVGIMNGWGNQKKGCFIVILKAVILLYAVNVVVSQVLHIAGADPGFLQGIFGRFYESRGGVSIVRYYGFSSEPSYAGFIVMTSFYAIYRLLNTFKRREVILYGTLMLYLIVSFDSLYTYLLASIVVATIARDKLPKWYHYVLPLILLCIGFISYTHSLFGDDGRMGKIVIGLIEGNEASVLSIISLDHSMFMRIAPVLQYIDSFDVSSLAYYFGHGAMASHEYFVNALYFHLNPETTHVFNPGLIAFFYDYGLIGGIIVIVWIWRRIRINLFSVPGLFIFLMFLNANFNTQLFWYLVIVFAIVGEYGVWRKPASISTAAGA